MTACPHCRRADVPSLQLRADALEAKFSAFRAEAARQRQELEALLAANEAVIALLSQKIARFQAVTDKS